MESFPAHVSHHSHSAFILLWLDSTAALSQWNRHTGGLRFRDRPTHHEIFSTYEWDSSAQRDRIPCFKFYLYFVRPCTTPVYNVYKKKNYLTGKNNIRVQICNKTTHDDSQGAFTAFTSAANLFVTQRGLNITSNLCLKAYKTQKDKDDMTSELGQALGSYLYNFSGTKVSNKKIEPVNI